MINNVLIILLLISFSAKADEYLIKEMESLRDSLSFDDPARVDLTLRLADLYFDVSIREGKEVNISKLKEQRMRALDLYKHSLNGTNGIPKAMGQLRLKIEFQMARLLTRLSEGKLAEKHYINVYSNIKCSKKLKEQSALALAEWHEEEANYIEANKFYKESITLCEAVATCNYAHYRRAWLLYKDTKLDEAIAELEKSMWDFQGHIRENVLQDYIMFLSNQMSDGLNEYDKISKLSVKLNRPQLVRKLTEAFYVAGNRKAGSNLLAIVNKSNPNIYYEIRLLEEFYGYRNWKEVDKYLTDLEQRQKTDLPKKQEDAKETKEIIRRLLVQLDAEAQVVEDLNPYLLRSIDIYLTLYPNDDLRKKMQQGWLKAQSDELVKIKRLETWIQEDLKYGVGPAEIRKLRQTRLALAQKYKKSKIIIDEATEISKILKGTTEAREFIYVAAHQMYKDKSFAQSLLLFKKLIDWNIEKKINDKWGVLSQNLILDIYNKTKNYDGLISQVDAWLAVSEFNNKELAKENDQMKTIRAQARFQKAFSLGDNISALDEFMYFCKAGIYADKACPNAKVLAIKLKDQQKLIFLLKKSKDEKALLVEYELMGEFGKAAALYEKLELKRKSNLAIYLKSALLFELDQDFINRDRILRKMVTKIKNDKKIDPKFEALVFNTLDEANLINHNSLSIPWSASRKISLAHRLEVEKPSKKTKKIIMAQKESVGPIWSKMVLTKLQKEYNSISRRGFYGKGSKWRFKKRTNSMEKFSKIAKGYLEGADVETRIYILQMLKTTYQNLAIELYGTPMPEGLDPETIQSVMTQLQQLAEPFEKVASDYERLQNNELETLSADTKELLINNLESGNTDFASHIKLEQQTRHYITSLDFSGYSSLKSKLHANPENQKIIKELENYFIKQRSQRLAAYFTGRLKDIK